MIWYLSGIAVLVLGIGGGIVLFAYAKNWLNFFGIFLSGISLIAGMFLVFTPSRQEHQAEENMKNQLRATTLLNVTDYQTGGAVWIECRAENASITLYLLTTSVRGKEELLHFDTSTGEYEEINVATYRKWYPYDCGVKP